MRRLTLTLTLLLLVACDGAAGGYADPCDQHANSATCRLQSAQIEATLQSGDMTAVAQAANDRIQLTKRAIDLAQAAALAQLAGQQTQDASVLEATRAMQHLHATGTAIAQDLKATATAQAISAQQTADALIVERTQTAIAIARAQTATRDADLINATATAIAVKATSEAAQVESNRRQTEATLAGVKEFVMTLLFIGLCAGLTYLVIRLSYRVFKNLAHAIDVRASTIRVGPNNTRALILTQTGDVIDPQQMIGPHMLTAGRGQPVDAQTAEDLLRWSMTLDHSRREQLVRIAEAIGVFPKSDAVPLLPAPSPIQGEGRGEGQLQLPTAPAFAQLLTRWQPDRNHLLLGYGAGGPIYGGLTNLLSVAIIGRPNQGKSTLLRCVYLQCRMVGADVVIWDLHGSIVEDLPGAAAFTTVADIQKSLTAIERELKRRIDGHLHTERAMMLLLDEAPILFQSLPASLSLSSRIVLEGRKFQMFALIASQGMPASLFNGSLMRDAFSSRYAFQTTAAQARLIGFDPDHARLVEDLPPGVALLNGPVRTQAVAIPNTTEADVRAILATSAPSEGAPGRGNGSGNRSNGRGIRSGPEGETEGAPDVDPTRRDQIRQLLKERMPISKIIEHVWGVHGGSAYQKASQELGAILATLV